MIDDGQIVVITGTDPVVPKDLTDAVEEGASRRLGSLWSWMEVESIDPASIPIKRVHMLRVSSRSLSVSVNASPWCRRREP